MGLYLSRIRLDLPRLFAWAAARRLPLDDGDVGYTVHCALRMALGDAGPQPFAVHRLKHDWDREETVVYGYGRHDGDALRARLAEPRDPKAAEALAPPEVKAMPTEWADGQCFRFAVRACPVVRQDRDGDRARSRETDYFLVKTEGKTPEEHPLRREAVYADWLKRELAREGAAELLDAGMTGYRQIRVRRRGGAAAPIKPDASFQGRLRVRHSAAFQRLLARGVGRHRAFGFGMLLLRPD